MGRDDPSLAAALDLLERLGLARQAGQRVEPGQAAALAARVWPQAEQAQDAALALISPYLALTMLWRVLGRGLRGNPHHPRPLDMDGPRLAADLLAFLRLHARLLPTVLALTGLPESGLPAGELHGDGGWCDLCGQCCCHAGVVPAPPPGVDYPPAFSHALAGEGLWPQPFCPFLYQARERPLFFCAIHAVKPRPCSVFDRADCDRGRPGRGCLFVSGPARGAAHGCACPLAGAS